MNKPDFENLLEQKRYEDILQYFPHNIASALSTTVTTYSKDSPKGNTQVYLVFDVDASQLHLIYDYFVSKEWDKENLDIFKNILLDLKKIDDSLKPLTTVLGLHYTLDLTGGAIRDFITGKAKEISDLDIVINISGTKDLTFDLTLEETRENITIKDKFDKVYNSIEPQLSKLNLNDFSLNENSSNYAQLCYYLVSSLLKRSVNIKKSYPPRDIEQVNPENSDMNTFGAGTYDSLYLQSVLKTEDKNLNYPVDILLSNVGIQTYNSAFDFNLCNIYFNYSGLGGNLKESIHKDMDLSKINQYLENIDYNHGFIEDVIYKRITFSFTNFALFQVESSLTKHYPKLQAKYKDYKFYLSQYALKNCKTKEKYNKINNSLASLKVEDLASNIKDEIKEFLVATIKFNELDNKIPHKEFTSEKALRPRKI